jgi:predicted CoA-binding protein
MGGNAGSRLEANEADVPENVDIYYVIRQSKRVLNFHEQSTSQMSKDLRSGAELVG